MTDTAYNISISPKAAEQVKIRLIKRGTPESYLRLGVKGGGCSGFSYVIQFEDNPPKEKDLLFEMEGVKILVDKKSILYLNGSILNWESTLIHQGFKFNNPNEKSTCGCGTSFSAQ
jgi:iron-sulfur cluster assembly protein